MGETKTSISKVKSQLKDAKVAKAKEERANSSKRVREVMTSQSLKENSMVNSNQNAQKVTTKTSTSVTTKTSVVNLTSILKTSQLREAKEKKDPEKEEDQQNS